MNEKFWCGEAPTVCQICDRPIAEVFVDGKTQWDCWACMCKDCWETHGEGLGVGLGQMYGRQEDGRWLNIGDSSTVITSEEELIAFVNERSIEAEATLRKDYRNKR